MNSSLYRSDFDNKDGLILELKTKLFELTQNERNYESLSYAYKKLQYE
jgi:hypothetical protein